MVKQHDHTEMSSKYCPVCGDKLKNQSRGSSDFIKGLKNLVKETREDNTTRTLQHVVYRGGLHVDIREEINKHENRDLENPMNATKINRYFNDFKMCKETSYDMENDVKLVIHTNDYPHIKERKYSVEEIREKA